MLAAGARAPWNVCEAINLYQRPLEDDKIHNS